MTANAHPSPRSTRLAWGLALIASLLAALAGLGWLRKRAQPPAAAPETLAIQGLTQAEVEARHVEGQSNAIHLHAEQTRWEMIRKNTMTVFNTGLVAIIGVQIMLNKELDALVSFGVLLFTVGVNVFQEEFARMRMRNALKAAQPTAVVIREGQVRSVEPDAIVPGDVVEFGPGDQIVVDGDMILGQDVMMEETLAVGRNQKRRKQPGDELLAGSLCLRGRGVMQVTRVGDDRLIARRLQHMHPAAESMTPIERLIDGLLKWLLAFVLAIAIFLLLKFFHLDAPLPQAEVDRFIDAIGVIFSIAPAGLYFMISLTYAAATVDLAKLRVLVHQARAIETLAQIDILFLNKSGFLTAQWMRIHPLAQGTKSGEDAIDDMTLRKMLGAFARSLSHQNQFTRTMQSAFKGPKLPPLEEMPFYSHYGWSGVRIEGETVKGVFVMGEPGLLAPYLVGEERAKSRQTAGVWAQAADRLGRWFHRAGPDAPEIAPREQGKIGGFKGLRQRMGALARRRAQSEPDRSTIEEEGDATGHTLLFAWSPEPQPLHDERGHPQLPQHLTPLCLLDYQERPDPAAASALAAFAADGVASKVFDPGPVEGIREALQRAGTKDSLAATFPGVSARELKGASDEALAEAVIRHHLIGDAETDLIVRAVKALRAQGHLVGVLGKGAEELDAMMASDLGITVISAASGALNIADIVLLDTSPEVITTMIDKGQRIVNGLLDVLKLYLTQAFYLLILVAALLIFLQSFPYRGAQGGLIAAFAISVPALALTLTAQPGRLQAKNVSASLFTFAIPASVTIALVGFQLFAQFLRLYGDKAYAQIALVHALIVMGLLLAVLLRPPLVLQKRLIPIKLQYFLPTMVALASGATFLLLTFIPLAQKYLYVTPLRSMADYMLVGGASLAWSVVFGAYLLATSR